MPTVTRRNLMIPVETEMSERLLRRIAEYWEGHDIHVRVEPVRLGGNVIHCIRSDIGERMRL